MKLEYLPDGPLIRLFTFTPDEVERLHSHVFTLCEGTTSRVDLGALPYIEAIDGCRLSFECQKWDQGIVNLGSREFAYRLTRESWSDVAGLLEPFMSHQSGFQYLTFGASEVELLISNSGTW